MTKQYRYLIGVSGGPDSMALLDMSIKKGYYVEVAHVNYHKRETAKRDEDTVFSYCQKHNIPFHLLNSNPSECEGNFQAFARRQRYEFFGKICEENGLDAVLIAHHRDDFLETYYMQKQKNLGVSAYGLKKTNIVYGVKVIRPLLSKTKKELTDYCIKNDIAYGIDESNETDDYERNRIRHSIVEKMSIKEKRVVASLIRLKNKELENQIKEASSYLKKELYDTEEFLSIPYLKRYLRQYFTGVSKDFMNEMLRQLKDSDKCRFDSDTKTIVKHRDVIEFYDRQIPYEYTFNSLDELLDFKHKFIKIGSKGSGVNGVYVNENDFPLTIRTYKQGDTIKMRFGQKKVNRFFIDRKINAKDKERWPLLFNCKNELILLPGLGCDFSHYSVTYNIFIKYLW